MHNERVTYDDLGAEMGVTKAYVSMILNGQRKPEGIQERMEAAFNAIIQRRKEQGV
jgi:transcriptional regulator with XRE-family HTH domain